MGRKYWRALKVSVFGDQCQRGENLKPKAKGPHHQLQKFDLFTKVCFSNWYLLKPSWKLRGEFHPGGVLFSQRKSIWNRGRKFQILKMLLKILFIYLWLLCKRLWKEFPKHLQNKTCGASVVQNFKLEESHPCISSRNNYWFHSKQPLHLPYAN